MSLKYIDRFHPRQRARIQAALESDHLHQLDELALLEQDQLRPLALLALLMLIVGAIFFSILNLLAYYCHMHTLSIPITFWGIVFWLLINALGYFIILPIHEIIHGLVFLLWGGRPYFGARLPLALFCGAKYQLFHRNHYLTVGLAPLVIITLVGIIGTLYFPVLASYTLCATIGNFSGAAGDVMVAKRLLRFPKNILVEDTEAGCRIWEISEPA